jgi:hypothetical protein
MLLAAANVEKNVLAQKTISVSYFASVKNTTMPHITGLFILQ